MVYLTSWVMRVESFQITFFIYVIIFLSFFCSKMVAVSPSWTEIDRLGLLAFKAKITDDPLGIMRSWNDSTHFCEWYGVTCSPRNQRVTQLNLLSSKLAGSISPHIGNLSFLHVLQLQNNSFIGQIPPQIGLLHRLQVLNLLNNSLGGKIPLNLSRCSELRSLILSNNKLQGEIPRELGSLSNLQYFGASKNNLIGHLPSSFGNLTFLENLLVSFNNLVGRIPETFGSLSHLTVLAIGGNYFSGDPPSTLFNISSMEILDVGDNQLVGRLPPHLFNTLSNLQYLSIQTNQFIGHIPISLSNASNLQQIQLSENKLTGKVPSLERLNMLWSFRVFLNQLGSGAGAKDDLNFLCSLGNATSLQFLSINNNNFGGVLPECITNLSSQLIHLSISDNYISGSIPPSIDNLIGLNALWISNNSFTGIIPPTIGNLEDLVLLYLSENSLSGLIPSSLGKLSNLNELDLSSNALEGTIPSSLQNCTFLQIINLDQNKLNGSIPPQVLSIPSLSLTLSLSHNQLTGFLPEEVGKLTNLNVLDVSVNMLSGSIPNSLGECTSMQFLYLGGNNFQGPIPSSLSALKGLQMLDLSSNNLSGQIPEFLASFDDLVMLDLSFNDFEGDVPNKGVFLNASATSLEGNSKLCGGILAFHLLKCSNSTGRKKRKLSVKTKAIIAIAVGFLGVALMILFLSIFVIRRKQRQSQEQTVVSSLENPAFQFVSYGDLHRATNGFSEGNLVGVGGFGHVYKGVLAEGEVVAIKVLNLKKFGASRSFISECEALRNIRHRNLVKLLTVCSGVDYQGNEFKALVFEFMSNGSLEDWLHLHPCDETVNVQSPNRKLGLLNRLNIAIDVASLLEYVHHQFGTPLVHCDIKPSNILLDDDLCAHVSDFGLSKFLSDIGIILGTVHPSGSLGVRGTVGYAPPEYGLGSEVSTQGDVYSYGIVLLELLTGKRPTHEMFKEGLSLHLYAKMALPNTVVEILDPTLQDCLEVADHERVVDCLASVIEIGVGCSLESPTERMDMHVVSAKLRKIKGSLLRGRK